MGVTVTGTVSVGTDVGAIVGPVGDTVVASRTVGATATLVGASRIVATGAAVRVGVGV
jgi:hypothetical protein